MKGDFTRSTFRPQKHYTSVRMQQGRLQLDSDWNEQADIQNHLRRAQAIDMIGSASGAGSVDVETGSPSQVAFKVVEITARDDDSPVDLAIIPGHFYVEGTLCELESGRPFKATFTDIAQQKVEVPSLTVDGYPLEPDQWLEIVGYEKNGKTVNIDFSERFENAELTTISGLRIDQPINRKTREIILDGNLSVQMDSAGGNISDTEEDGPKETDFTAAKYLLLRRVTTYRNQIDYPVSDQEPDGRYLAYLDVWQRHITAEDDHQIRERALNVPDTTTRSQTIWQLKLKPYPENSEQTVDKFWEDFLQNSRERERDAVMNACAGLCDRTEGQSAPPLRLENQLYRVEIHTQGKVNSLAGFKWSRNNASLVSRIESIDQVRNIIRIRHTNQDAWATTQPGQWLELTTNEQELRGESGVLVPFERVMGNQITLNTANIIGNTQIPDKVTKVRRWDHNAEQVPQGVIPLQSTWTPVEAGIKVKFDQGITYEPGDYWLIPARSGPQDIEWPNDQASENPQPIAQSPAGIHHEYGLLGVVNVETTGFSVIKDERRKIPPLLRALDTAGGEITGSLVIAKNLSVFGDSKLNNLKIEAFEVVKTPTEGDSVTYGRMQSRESGESKTIEFSAEEGVNFAFLNGDVGIGKSSQLFGGIRARESDESKTIDFFAEEGVNFTFLNGDVIIGTSADNDNLKVNGTAQLQNGVAINEFSNDITLSGDSNDAVPTEKAVKNYIDDGLATKADLRGNPDINFAVDTLNGKALNLGSEPTISEFSNDITLADGSEAALPTEKAVKTYVDAEITEVNTAISQKANLNGDLNQNFNVKALTGESLNLGSEPTISEFSNDITLADGSEAALPTEKAVKTYVDAKITEVNTAISQKANLDGDSDQNFNVNTLLGKALNLGEGPVINAFSSDGTLGDSNNVLPTEKAVKTYVDSAVIQARPDISQKADLAGDSNQNFNANIFTGNALKLGQGATINVFTVDGTLDGNSDNALPTEQAVKTYVDNKLSEVNNNLDSKVDIGGDIGQDFAANRFFAKEVATTTINTNVVLSGEVQSSNLTQISSRTLKKDIAQLSTLENSVLLQSLNPVKFTYKNDLDQAIRVGFIAEDTPDLLASANKQAVKLLDVIAVLTKAIKDDRETISNLMQLSTQQQHDIANLHQTVEELQLNFQEKEKTISNLSQLSSQQQSEISSLHQGLETLQLTFQEKREEKQWDMF